MVSSNAIDEFALQALRIRTTKVLPAQVRRCIEELNDEQLWWRPNPQSNSVGNLVLHLRGAVLHYLCCGVGGLEYQRDRPAEFSASVRIDKQTLLAMFDDMVEKATQTFKALNAVELGEPSTEPKYYSILFEDLFGIVIHLATHTGQIVYLTKMLKENSIDELWMRTHRESGAWKA